MTALDRQLVKTFRWARWRESAGVPICPGCFDGEDLLSPKDDPLTPGLSLYRCIVCHLDFTDTKGTVFESRKPVPLAHWAYLVLLGDPARLPGITQHELSRYWTYTAKLKDRALPGLWREQLEADGVTAERIRTRLMRTTRRAA